MNRIGLRSLAVAVTATVGLVTLAPALAGAFTGSLAACSPSAGIVVPMKVNPGWVCTDTLSTITLTASADKSSLFDNCTANAAAPWDTWAAAGYGSKISAAAATTISKVEFKMTAKGFQPCKAGGDATSALASGSGTFKFFKSDGARITKATGSFYGVVSLDVPLQSAVVRGIVTKDFGIGAAIEARIHVDVTSGDNSNLLPCNLGGGCPPPLAATTKVGLKTASGDLFRIDFPDNAHCTAAHIPMYCCTGSGSGGC